MDNTNDKIYCVYAHINKINGKIYIGQTGQDVNRRWRNGEGYKRCTHFYNAIQKYGWDNFEHEIIASNLTLKEANHFEELLIDKLDTMNPNKGYNLRSGGENYFVSDEMRLHMCQNRPNINGKNNPFYGKHHTNEARQKMSESCKGKYKGQNNPFYGKRHTEATRKKISQSLKNLPSEVWEKINNSHKKEHLTEEHRAKISNAMKGDKNHFYGKHHTNETKRKLSESKTNKKRMLCVETNIVYPSMREAERQTGISRQNICSSLKTKGAAGGYHWRYADDTNTEDIAV